MNSPKISAICLTYGRVARLQELLACFVAQTWQNKELIVLNTFAQQTLGFVHPQVKIVNVRFRPASLGATRNFAAGFASGDVMTVMDDDDLFLPHHLQVIGEAFAETKAEVVRILPVFYSEAWKIKNTFDTWANAVSFTKKAFKAVGGYSPDLSCGEDRQFVGKLSEKFQVATVELQPHEISAIYCWGNMVHHLSGQGDDKPGSVSCYERARSDLESRVSLRQEPIGGIELKPALEHDPTVMAGDWLQRNSIPGSNRAGVAIVELGRYGDIINVLPIARHIAENYEKPRFIVSKEFASVLEGCSYVQPVALGIDNSNVNEGFAYADSHFRHVLKAQIWGHGHSQARECHAYNQESWRMCGFLHRFEDMTMLPFFDRRDAGREELLRRKHFLTTKKKIIVSAKNSVSSPFDHYDLVMRVLRDAFGTTHEIVDLSVIRAERVYDLLGLLEHAHCLVTIDTMPLHLAAATDIPTVALTNDKDWCGTMPRCNWVCKQTYGSFVNRPIQLVTDVEEALDYSSSIVYLHHKPIRTAPTRTIWHACEHHKETGERSIRRKAAAQDTWRTMYHVDGNTKPAFLTEINYKRNAMDIGDIRPLPYLKDVLEFAMLLAGPDDIIMWTNDDNYLHPGLGDMLRFHCGLWGCVSAQRCEFYAQPVPKMNVPVEEIVRKEVEQNKPKHMGRDLFAFTVTWMKQHWSQIPDFIIGAPEFDLCLAAMIRKQWHIDSDRGNLEIPMWPCELPKGYVSHRYHQATWNDPKWRDTSKANIHNRTLFFNWATEHLPNLHFDAHMRI